MPTPGSFVGVILRQVVITAAGADGADLRVVQHDGLIDCAGESSPGMVRSTAKWSPGTPEGGEILDHQAQLLQTLVKDLFRPLIGFQGRQHLGIGASDGDKTQNLLGAAWEIPCSTSRAWTFSGPILSSLSTVRMISRTGRTGPASRRIP